MITRIPGIPQKKAGMECSLGVFWCSTILPRIAPLILDKEDNQVLFKVKTRLSKMMTKKIYRCVSPSTHHDTYVTTHKCIETSSIITIRRQSDRYKYVHIYNYICIKLMGEKTCRNLV